MKTNAITKPAGDLNTTDALFDALSNAESLLGLLVEGLEYYEEAGISRATVFSDRRLVSALYIALTGIQEAQKQAGIMCKRLAA